MAENWGTDRTLTRVNYCIYVDEDNIPYFCVMDFLRQHCLPDVPGVRRLIADDIKRLALGVLILEEQISEEQN
jgi:hypothetical protein